MNCKDFTYNLENSLNGDLSKEMKEHMSNCEDCKKYFSFIYNCIEEPNKIMSNEPLKQSTANEIKEFALSKISYSKQIPLWIRLTSAAAAIILGLFIGYSEFQKMNNNQNELSINNQTDNNFLIVETTDQMYQDFIYNNENE